MKHFMMILLLFSSCSYSQDSLNIKLLVEKQIEDARFHTAEKNTNPDPLQVQTSAINKSEAGKIPVLLIYSTLAAGILSAVFLRRYLNRSKHHKKTTVENDRCNSMDQKLNLIRSGLAFAGGEFNKTTPRGFYKGEMILANKLKLYKLQRRYSTDSPLNERKET